tara:strand:+ start:490 stop:720 length:231 start_codon:yes stop_codon:yes gene_type:complete
MKYLLTLLVLLWSLCVAGQERDRRSCIKQSVQKQKDKVIVTVLNKCTAKKTTKTYTLKEWEKILADRKKTRRRPNS